jgi:hypothetical protein
MIQAIRGGFNTKPYVTRTNDEQSSFSAVNNTGQPSARRQSRHPSKSEETHEHTHLPVRDAVRYTQQVVKRVENDLVDVHGSVLEIPDDLDTDECPTPTPTSMFRTSFPSSSHRLRRTKSRPKPLTSAGHNARPE